MLRNFFLGFIRIHILYHAALAPVYGTQLMAELARHGYQISPGTLYPVLRSLEKEGYLASERRVVSGKVRKYYHITLQGKVALAEARAKIMELVREVIQQE